VPAVLESAVDRKADNRDDAGVKEKGAFHTVTSGRTGLKCRVRLLMRPCERLEKRDFVSHLIPDFVHQRAGGNEVWVQVQDEVAFETFLRLS